MQPPPHLEVRMAPGGFQPVVALLWTGPLQPNGKVIYYELYRRQIAAHPGKSNPVLTYNGSSSSFTDFELSPFTEYEYQVRNVYYQQFTLRPYIYAPQHLPVKIPCNLKSHLEKCGA